MAWVLRHIDAHGGIPARVAIGGHSAGAHLMAMCLPTPWADDYGLPDDPLKAAVLVSGIYDIEPLRYSYLQSAIQWDDGIIRRHSPMYPRCRRRSRGRPNPRGTVGSLARDGPCRVLEGRRRSPVAVKTAEHHAGSSSWNRESARSGVCAAGGLSGESSSALSKIMLV